jgi:hypothetical protein
MERIRGLSVKRSNVVAFNEFGKGEACCGDFLSTVSHVVLSSFFFLL